MGRETKTLSFQIKDLGVTTDDSGNEFGHIEAYGAIVGNVDEGNDVIMPGSFKRTIQASKSRAEARQSRYLAPMLWQHNTSEIIGGWHQLVEDNTGLKGIGDINLATQRGREYYALSKSGMSSELSIIYDVPSGGSKYRKDGVRELTELRLFSMDPVTFGMNNFTYVVDVKSQDLESAPADPPTPDAPKEKSMQKKTFAEHLAEEMNEDMLEDWQDVIISALTSAVFDAMKIGDTPEADVQDALTAFNEAVMAWVAQGVQYGLSAYLSDQSYDMGTQSTMQNGSGSGYGMMSRATPISSKNASQGQLKAMTASDATTGGITADHVSALHNAATRATKKVTDHADALHDAADTVSGMISAAKAKSLQLKEGRAFSSANMTALQDHADGLHSMADTLTKSVARQMKSVTTVADDLATRLQGSEAAYGTDPGTPAPGQQEGKSASYSGTRAPDAPPSATDTATEDDFTAALARLQSLRSGTPATA